MRIAIATVGTTGDVRPFAALAPALVAKGHSVTAISWELHRGAFEGTGADFVAAGPPTGWDEIREAARRAAAAHNPQQQVAVLRDFHLRDAAAHYAALRGVLPGHDLVLLHGIHSLAEAAALDAGLQYATAVFDPVLLPTREHPPAGMPALGPLNSVGWWLLDRMLSGVARPLEVALRAAGSGSGTRVRLFRARSPLLHLVACSPALSPPPRDLPPSTVFTGAWVASGPPEPLPADVEEFIAAGPPPAVVSFGSMAVTDPRGLGSTVATALQRAGLRAIVQRGAADLAPTPSATLLPVGALDHRALFPRAAVIVHHGGAGTSHAAVASGKPSVVVPHVGDQAYWADRLHRLGVAPDPLPATKLDAVTLATRIGDAAASGRMRESAGQLAATIGSEDGVAEAVRRVVAAAGVA